MQNRGRIAARAYYKVKGVNELASRKILVNKTIFIVVVSLTFYVINVRITAYRGNESLSWETECGIVSGGSVLDELITVLR